MAGDYDFDDAYARIAQHYIHDTSYVAMTLNSYGREMTNEVMEHFTEAEYGTVSKAMMLLSGMLGGLASDQPNVPLVAASNILAIGGYNLADEARVRHG